MVSRCLCRLCEFPAADGGVPLVALDADKWAEWCRRKLGEEMQVQVSSDVEKISVICQYCIWEARLVHESLSPDDNESDWWTGHDDDHFFQEYFYKTSMIQPCKVVLENIPSELDHLGTTNIAIHHRSARLRQNFDGINPLKLELKSCKKSANLKIKLFRCTLCQETVNSLLYHMKKTHKNFVRCRRYRCATYFFTETEKEEHEQKFHLNDGALVKIVKCNFCDALITSQILHSHFKGLHKEAIRCDYSKKCPNYFHTETEKNEHIFNEHTQGLKLKFTPLKCIYCNELYKSKHHLQTHVHRIHKDVKIKCRVNGCVVYFLNQKESDEHFLKVHQHAESLKKLQCQKCSYKSNNKPNLIRHLQDVHLKSKFTFKCPHCPKSFPAKSYLKVHLNGVHGELGTCKYCGKALRKTSMLSHFSRGACKPDSLHPV